MKRLVLDASVAVKLLFLEEMTDTAETCLDRAQTILAPDLMLAEVGNVIWKRFRSGGIAEEAARQTFETLNRLPVQFVSVADLVGDALDLAMHLDRSVYDCVYLALAMKRSAPLVTADKRFANALENSKAKTHIRWLGEFC